MKKPNVSIGFLGNIYFDTRTYNLFNSLKLNGHNVIFNGFDWITPGFKTIMAGEIRIIKLVKHKFSLPYYMKFAFLLFFSLMKQKADIYFAADVYSLPFCTMAAGVKKKRVFYDAREIYPELSGVKNKSLVKRLIQIIESFCIKRVGLVITTGEMDSKYIENCYRIANTVVLRNLPLKRKNFTRVDFYKKYSIFNTAWILVYQGIIMPGRGIETIFKVLQKYSDSYFIILGWGEFQSDYEQEAVDMGIHDRVFFAGKVPQDELQNYTAGGDVGLCLIDNISFNNYYALPNKLFEYIMAGLPVIVSDLPQMKAVVEKYNIGAVVPEGDEDEVIRVLKKWKERPSLYNNLKQNCKLASEELNWEREFGKVLRHFQ